MGTVEDDEVAELTTFQSKEAYVYAPLPPAPHYGHRAELWGVNDWLREVKVRVVTRQDDCFVRMEDQQTGELFAECPLPNDGTSLTTAVEPVVDSSRYFVVRVVDRSDAKKHAFIGLGFRERDDASDFTAALDDYRQLVRRSKEAEEMRQRFEGLGAASSSGSGGLGGEGGGEGAAGGEDYRLRESIRLKLSNSIKRGDSGGEEPRTLLMRLSGSVGTSGAAASGVGVVPSPTGGLKLQPPPSGSSARNRLALPGSPRLALPSSPGVSLGGVAPAAAATAAPAAQATAGGAGGQDGSASAGEDDWADFQS